uniref:Reverse transcriptase domain-containing protein n=1 Tax=Tanacetum cinerariifolium TaxID=118510 RepID=A0A6L2MY39_TANCI|nr:hypothetical protein [Tanacetum cinerariifolium]
MPFGLKNAPSVFQKVMITIFEPILANTLVYIDDILLFSPDEQSHAELLSKFYSLVTKYEIMLSEKKMEVGVTTIQFLGMEISDGKYQPQPHVAQESLKFLAKTVTSHCLVVPHVKKESPQWTSKQTEAVKAIKRLAEKMPPLKIPASSEKRILQTDANDEYKLRSYVVKSQFKDVSPILKIYLLCYNETSDDIDDARSLWSSDDDEHFDPFEDDPTHPDARWSL